ncbi:MAG TPA: hypothetical protein VN175_05605 [Rhizomicrobium sp.]|jgi:hypothetical protein|nr:hypothetical protein [Rhizomicrobium sp.]
MPIFVCKRYRRSAAGAATGSLTDEWSFSAASAMEAEAKMRRELLTPMWEMDWKNYFATLENEDGQVLAQWLHGLLHA